MRNFAVFLLIFMSSLTYSYDVDLSKWQLIDGSDNLKVYTHKKEKGHKLSIQLKESKFKDWDKASGDEVYDSIVAKKRKMLSLLGIKNWQVKSKDWRPGKDLSRLEIKGEYMNSRNQRVEFREIHEFSKGEKRQYLFTYVIKS